MAKKQKEEKPKMALGIKGERGSVVMMENPKSKSPSVQIVSEKKEMEKQEYPARIRNSRYHPVTLSYEGKALVMAPRQEVKVADYRKLGSLSAGVVILK